MSDTPETPNGAPSGGATPNGTNGADAAQAPSLVVLAQYLKDLSFENPHAPMSFQGDTPPSIEVNVDVNGRSVGTDQYEVELSVAAHASRGGDRIFVVEASYAGVFEIKNIPRDQLEPVMLVECPRLMFPFLRQIVSDATRNGNFPPLMMEPIDFFAVYQNNLQRKAQLAAQQGDADDQPPADAS